ncbi:MAG TPA: 6-phosphogluconolactonase [Acidimicrobiales bacterium]|nr:6-phosphogluconolactonase [Acidimicrobiales bacterium]
MGSLEVLPDGAALAQAVAERIAAIGRQALRERGRFCLALSGGQTPAGMLGRLAESGLDWTRVELFQVDERVAPDGDPQRNLTQLQDLLLSRAPVPPSQVHPMEVTAADLEAAAAGYAKELQRVCAGVLDLVHLGLGADGHTASWPPGHPVADVSDRDTAVVGPFNGLMRMTLTPPPVNRSREIVWMVEGPAKSAALRRLLDSDPAIPASRVRRDRAVVMADWAAAGQRP